MSALFGWVGDAVEAPAEMLRRMAVAARSDGEAQQFLERSTAGMGVAGKATTFCLFEADGFSMALVGHPSVAGVPIGGSAVGARTEAFLASFRARGIDALRDLHGDFALAIHDAGRGAMTLAVDRSGVHPLCYQRTADGLVFGSTLDALACHPRVRCRIAPQAIYDFLFFHAVPVPSTIYEGTWRLPPGCALSFDAAGISVKPYWQMAFVEKPVRDLGALKQEFLATLQSATARAADQVACGSFLSGGTDSSTIAGMLHRATGRARTYSIGFDVPGYDEMDYARTAAQHFGTEHHEYYVTPADVLEAAPRIAEAYDQPFGNASAIPTYFCARLARADGIERLLGGDGGDELFGGNARYGKQNLLSYYQRIPAAARKHMLEPLLLGSDLSQRLPGVRKLRSYVEQARPPMPQRYESYNLLEHLDPQRVLTAEFLASVDRNKPHQLMCEAHAPFRDASLVNQMLGMDLRFTLADNDLPKVTRMCALAGADIAFPMLDDEVVAFSAALPRHLKLRGTELRPFFKAALEQFLPEKILRKKKHGFGLPVGEWLAKDPGLGALARDNLAWLRQRRIVRPEFLDELGGTLLHLHPGYYGTMVWLLVILALWMQSREV